MVAGNKEEKSKTELEWCYTSEENIKEKGVPPERRSTMQDIMENENSMRQLQLGKRVKKKRRRIPTVA